MKKRFFIVCFIAIMMLMFGGCCLKHEWVEATCTAPKSCIKCGKTEGEALPHQWTEATCSAPKTCSVCGLTEGEKLPHTWADATCYEPKTCTVCGVTEGEPAGHMLSVADYQNPATCLICGETVGEKLQPDFEIHNITVNMKPGETYSYTTRTKRFEDYLTIGELAVTEYVIFDSDEENGLYAQDGYEWHQVTFEMTFFDTNARKKGIMTAWNLEDYYNVAGLHETIVYHPENDVDTYTVRFNGETYDKCCNVQKGEWTNWVKSKVRKTKERKYTKTYSELIPIGYDGIVIGPRNAVVAMDDTVSILSDSIYDEEQFFLFRLDGNTMEKQTEEP